jgi:hypothetical protein
MQIFDCCSNRNNIQRFPRRRIVIFFFTVNLFFFDGVNILQYGGMLNSRLIFARNAAWRIFISNRKTTTGKRTTLNIFVSLRARPPKLTS